MIKCNKNFILNATKDKFCGNESRGVWDKNRTNIIPSTHNLYMKFDQMVDPFWVEISRWPAQNGSSS